MRYLLLAGLLMSSAAFSSTEDSAEYKEIKDLTERIHQLCAADLTCKTDSDCLPIALGAKACGGPRSYTMTSRQNASLAQIKTLASSLKSKEGRFNRKHQIISTCEVVESPNHVCEQQKCTTLAH